MSISCSQDCLVKFFPVLIALVLVFLVPPAMGHVPVIAGGNNNRSSATYIPDIARSWAVYSRLQARLRYISFDA